MLTNMWLKYSPKWTLRHPLFVQQQLRDLIPYFSCLLQDQLFIHHSFIHSFIRPSIHPFLHSLIYSFIHSFIDLFLHSLIYSFIHSFIHSFIQSSIVPASSRYRVKAHLLVRKTKITSPGTVRSRQVNSIPRVGGQSQQVLRHLQKPVRGVAEWTTVGRPFHRDGAEQLKALNPIFSLMWGTFSHRPLL